MADSASNKINTSNPLTFLADAKEELRKVTRPTKQEVTQAAIGTFVIILVLSVLLAIFDLVFNELTTYFLS